MGASTTRAIFSTCAAATTTTTQAIPRSGRTWRRLAGRFVHPQAWPEDLPVTKGKKVVVIGSGATAVTLVPELAKEAAHVTMLQRSPSYIATQPAEDDVRQAAAPRPAAPPRAPLGAVEKPALQHVHLPDGAACAGVSQALARRARPGRARTRLRREDALYAAL